MRRFTVGLAIVLALSLLLAAVAIAAPPICDPTNPRYDPNSPACSTDTTPTTPPELPDLQPCPESFTLSGSGWSDFECDWTPANTGAMEGIVTVDVEGEVRLLTVAVRDSAPGDYCDLVWEGNTPGDSEWYVGSPTGDLVLTFPLTDDRGTYWNFMYTDNDGAGVASSGEHWCGPYDPIDGLRTDLNGDPLHLSVGLRGKKTASVTVTLMLEQATTTTP
jgi:hypothetical protein